VSGAGHSRRRSSIGSRPGLASSSRLSRSTPSPRSLTAASGSAASRSDPGWSRGPGSRCAARSPGAVYWLTPSSGDPPYSSRSGHRQLDLRLGAGGASFEQVVTQLFDRLRQPQAIHRSSVHHRPLPGLGRLHSPASTPANNPGSSPLMKILTILPPPLPEASRYNPNASEYPFDPPAARGGQTTTLARRPGMRSWTAMQPVTGGKRPPSQATTPSQVSTGSQDDPPV
jgi:hypothetical protein